MSAGWDSVTWQGSYRNAVQLGADIESAKAGLVLHIDVHSVPTGEALARATFDLAKVTDSDVTDIPVDAKFIKDGATVGSVDFVLSTFNAVFCMFRRISVAACYCRDFKPSASCGIFSVSSYVSARRLRGSSWVID